MSNTTPESIKGYEGLIKKIEPFNYLDEDTLNKVSNRLQVQKYPEGSYIFRKGESSKKVLFVLLNGKVELLTKDTRGNEVLQLEVMPHSSFGTPTFLTGESYALSARVSEEADCLLLDEETYEELSEANSQFSNYFKLTLGGRVKDLYKNYMFVEKSDLVDEYFKDETLLWLSVRDNIVTSVKVCNKKDSITTIAKIMEEYKISSVVVLDDSNHVHGIITEQDIAHKVVAKGLSPDYTFAEDICSQDLITLNPNEHMYKALILMIKYKIKHLVVTEKNGELAGILTIRDLIKSKEIGALDIANDIDNAESIRELVKPRESIDILMAELVNKKASTEMICEIINEFYDQLTRKVIEFAEKEMEDEGYGPPPVNYSFISMGSSGRKEQLMRTDMDNGIIYDNPDPDKEKDVQNYFLELGEKIILGLIKCGFMECPDNVMANNKNWCRSIKSWREQINKWADSPGAKYIKNLSIFVDFRHIHGDENCYNVLKKFVTRIFRESIIAKKFLAKNIQANKPPFGAFKRRRRMKGENMVNLKESACVHIVDAIKVFSLRESIVETNTFDRLQQLQEKNVFADDEAKFIYASYDILMTFRLQENVDKKKQRIIPDDQVDLNKLSAWEKNLLKESLNAVDNLQGTVSRSFHAFV